MVPLVFFFRGFMFRRWKKIHVRMRQEATLTSLPNLTLHQPIAILPDLHHELPNVFCVVESRKFSEFADEKIGFRRINSILAGHSDRTTFGRNMHYAN